MENNIISLLFQSQILKKSFDFIIIVSWKLFSRILVQIMDVLLEVVLKDDQSRKRGDIEMSDNFLG